jgi:hypothetical protein
MMREAEARFQAELEDRRVKRGLIEEFQQQRRLQALAAQAAIEQQRSDQARKQALELELAVERTEYRRRIEEGKLVRLEQRQQAAREQEALRLKRLQRLVDTVKFEAAADSDRLLQPTAAWASRMVQTRQARQDTLIQRGLIKRFVLNGYSSETIAGDPRVAVEIALRNAGVLGSSHAQTALKAIAPPQQPRRDQTSCLFADN